MKQREKYKTTNKDYIMNCIKKYNSSFTVQELYKYMKENNYNVGLTTIYRYIEELLDNNILNKSYDNNIANYQYLESCTHGNHFYLRCNVCGSLIHIDCDCILTLQDHIRKEHKFETDNKNIIISGTCNKCLGGK